MPPPVEKAPQNTLTPHSVSVHDSPTEFEKTSDLAPEVNVLDKTCPKESAKPLRRNKIKPTVNVSSRGIRNREKLIENIPETVEKIKENTAVVIEQQVQNEPSCNDKNHENSEVYPTNEEGGKGSEVTAEKVQEVTRRTRMAKLKPNTGSDLVRARSRLRSRSQSASDLEDDLNRKQVESNTGGSRNHVER